MWSVRRDMDNTEPLDSLCTCRECIWLSTENPETCNQSIVIHYDFKRQNQPLISNTTQYNYAAKDNCQCIEMVKQNVTNTSCLCFDYNNKKMTNVSTGFKDILSDIHRIKAKGQYYTTITAAEKITNNVRYDINNTTIPEEPSVITEETNEGQTKETTKVKQDEFNPKETKDMKKEIIREIYSNTVQNEIQTDELNERMLRKELNDIFTQIDKVYIQKSTSTVEKNSKYRESCCSPVNSLHKETIIIPSDLERKFTSVIPKFDVVKKLVEAYKECRCKVCKCLARKMNENGPSQSYESERLQEIPAKTCKRLDAMMKLIDPTVECDCGTCWCHPCKSIYVNQYKKQAMIVAAVRPLQNLPPQPHQCPDGCQQCSCLLVPPPAPREAHEMCVGVVRHQHCHCPTCSIDVCEPDDYNTCLCERATEVHAAVGVETREVAVGVERHENCRCEPTCLADTCEPDDREYCRCERQFVTRKPTDMSNYNVHRTTGLLNRPRKHWSPIRNEVKERVALTTTFKKGLNKGKSKSKVRKPKAKISLSQKNLKKIYSTGPRQKKRNVRASHKRRHDNRCNYHVYNFNENKENNPMKSNEDIFSYCDHDQYQICSVDSIYKNMIQNYLKLQVFQYGKEFRLGRESLFSPLVEDQDPIEEFTSMEMDDNDGILLRDIIELQIHNARLRNDLEEAKSLTRVLLQTLEHLEKSNKQFKSVTNKWN